MSTRAWVAFAAVSTRGIADREEMRVTDPDGYVLMIAQIDAAT